MLGKDFGSVLGVTIATEFARTQSIAWMELLPLVRFAVDSFHAISIALEAAAAAAAAGTCLRSIMTERLLKVSRMGVSRG